MSNEELIAQARELCEQQIADHTPRESWTVENYPAYWLAHYQTTLKAWTTHLAEMEEHQAIEHCKNPLCPGPVCSKCGSKDTLEVPYPCNYLLTKAKRLLGVRSD